MIVRVMGRESRSLPLRGNISASQSRKRCITPWLSTMVIEKIDPDESVSVEMPVADDIRENTSRVYSVSSGGSLKRIETASANGTKIFKTEKLGDFVMAGRHSFGSRQSEKTQ